jgi:hypothetical protein
VKLREKKLLSRFITNIFVKSPNHLTFAKKKKIRFTPNQRKTPSPSGLGFLVLNAFKSLKRLQAILAAVHGLAGGRPKGRNAFGLGTSASWAVQGNAVA